MNQSSFLAWPIYRVLDGLVLEDHSHMWMCRRHGISLILSEPRVALVMDIAKNGLCAC